MNHCWELFAAAAAVVVDFVVQALVSTSSLVGFLNFHWKCLTAAAAAAAAAALLLVFAAQLAAGAATGPAQCI